MNEHANTNASLARTSFGGEELQVQHETSAVAVAAAAKAAIEARYILAMKRPRDWDTVRIRLLKECERPGFADAAIYKKPVGKKRNNETGRWEENFVKGLSIRFAEAALRHLTNFYSSSTVIYDDPTKCIVRVTVMDLESNATLEHDVHVTKSVERRELRNGQKPLGQRVNSYGDVVYLVPATDDEVMNKMNALISKALRNGVARLLPGDIQDECEEACLVTQAKRDKEDPDGAKKKLFDGFAKIGVEPRQLKEYLGHQNDQLQPAELADLRGIYSAISSGETTWAAVMEARVPPSGEGEKEPQTSAAAKKTTEILEKHKQQAADKKASGGKGALEGPTKDAAPAGAASVEQPRGREPGED